MWFIKNAQGEIIYLKPNKLMIVSRKEGHDVVLNNDASISKLHASITVRPKINFKHNEPSSTVVVEDTGSKYGTFIINDKNQSRKLTQGEHVLTETDRIKFGLVHHIFTLHYVPLIISTSTLNANEKIELQNIIDTLDGVIVEKWEEYCTHLTVSNVTLTSQVVQALAFGTPIVSLKYWKAVLRNVDRNEELPSLENFIPSINEGLINRDSVSLKTNVGRKVLFKSLIFVHFSASQCSLKNIIKSAGGKLVYFKDGLLDIKQLCSKNVIVLQLANSESQPSQASVASYDLIQKGLQEKKRRLIPESEIFLAILYCSIEKYCNPKFDFKQLIGVSENINKKQLSATILAPDTEDILPTTQRVTHTIIKESLTLSEQMEEQEAGNLKKGRVMFGQKQNSENVVKDSTQRAVANKRNQERLNFGSEESSREDALMIDETRSSIESDSNDASSKRPDSANDIDETVDKSKTSATLSTGQRFNLQSKLQTSKVCKQENIENNETHAQRRAKNTGEDLFPNPSTSKDTSWTKFYQPANDSFDSKETKPRKLIVRNASDQKSKDRNNETVVNRKKDVNIRHREDEDDMFSFVNEGPAKKRKTVKKDDEADSFELLENPNAKRSHQVENMFEKELNKIKNYQKKRRRSSMSSNSSIEEEPQKIKIEKLDTDEDEFDAPLIRCKNEFNNSMNETCKSTIIPLLRKDIDLTLNTTAACLKTFVKVYTLIPKQRIKMKDMYVWKGRDDITMSESYKKELTSSSEDDDDFKFHSNTAAKKPVRAKK